MRNALHRSWRTLTVLLVGLCAAHYVVSAQGRNNGSELSGLATVSGVVTAPKPFKAAQVYLRNVEKRIQYMVYTSDGRYRAMHLFPGTYEVRATTSGLDSSVQQVMLTAGDNTVGEIALKDAGNRMGEAQLVSFDEMYPSGQGADFVKTRCVGCHGPNFLPNRTRNAQQWRVAVDTMNQIGFITATPVERDAAVAYLSKHFDVTSPKRAVNWNTPVPVDERKLSKALYIEYLPPPNPPGTRARQFQDPHFDPQGDVWFGDRSTTRLLRLDPRTGQMKEWPAPRNNDLHGITIDSQGVVWIAELRGDIQLRAFDPKTEKFQSWPIDPQQQLGRLGYDQNIIDADENVWFTLVYGDALGKWDRKTQQISIYKTPTTHSFPYGMDIDSKGNIWVSEFVPGKLGKFDPKTETWSEHAVPTQPSKMRRMSVDSEDNVWYGLYSHGIIGKFEPTTGKFTEVKVPSERSQPYDVWPDGRGNIWFTDNGQGGSLVKYEPRSRGFTFFPTPQLSDQPKIEITKDGAIWYCARGAAEGGVGVLYPDMTKVTTLAAYYPHGVAHGSKYLRRSETTR